MYQYQELTPFSFFESGGSHFQGQAAMLTPETFARKSDECLQLPDKAKVT
jgi:hypothetical protein